MISKIIRVLGIIIFVSFSTFSMLLFQFERSIKDNPNIRPEVKKILSYPSFFEDRFYDFRMNLTLNHKQMDNDLVLAAIDESSLKTIGRWPWTRLEWVKIMNKLKHYGAKVVAFDVVMPEPEKACNAESPDILLAKSFKEFQSIPGNHVILPYSLTTIYSFNDDVAFKEFPDQLLDFMIDTKQSGDKGFWPRRVMRTTFPIKEILSSNVGLSYIGADEDSDGLFRRYPLITNVDDLYFPSFALQAYQFFTGDKNILLNIKNDGDGLLKLKSGEIALNYQGESKIRWLGGPDSFPVIGLDKIRNGPLNDKKIKNMLNGKLVFIGSTAFGAHDLRHTPVDAKLPGVYFHMNMVHMLTQGKFFYNKADSLAWSWSILALGTFLVIIISLLGNAIFDAIFVLLFCSFTFLFDTYYLLPKGYEITLFFALFSTLATYSWNTLLNFYLANKDKAFLKNAFGAYISPELIDEMYSNGEHPTLGGKADILTAYFTDIQGFSTFSEQLTATQLVELLNEYLSAMTEILLNEKGTLDKYEGDAIIAFFGAPMELKDHAIRSCRVALSMQSKLVELTKKWQGEGDKWPKIVHEMKMRIGINSGEIVTGNMGSATRMNYTMMGDSVNLAARLEESAKQYGIFTQVSQFTKDLTEDYFEMRELDTVRVVGKSEPITTFDLIGIKGQTSEDLVKLKELFHEGLANYKSQQWDKAIELFNQSLEYEYKRFPDLKGKKTNPSLIFIERCQQFKENPPEENWDGVFTLTSK